MTIDYDFAELDVIGDIHGHADQLRRLLHKLDFREVDGVFRHENRKAVFVGDLIDRGPQQVAVYRMVRAMCEAGTAYCVLGNHEFNAIGWVTTDGRGEPLRRHSDTNHRQHREFLEQVGGAGSALHHEIVDWFKTLPVWIETERIRIIHACWHEESRLALEQHVDDGQSFTASGLTAALTRGTEAYNAADVLLKGPEIPLPHGIVFNDAEGTIRNKARVNWWSPSATTYRTAAIIYSEAPPELPNVELSDTGFRYRDPKPVLFGHYWLSGEPRLDCANAVCLDYSVARDGGLVAYRWSGETELTEDNLVLPGE